MRHGQGSYAFDWEVKAMRRGYEDYRPVRPAEEHTRARQMLSSASGHQRKAAPE